MNEENTPPDDVQEATPVNKLIFSLITGDIFEMEADEMKNIEKHQIPLTHKPQRSCKKCYGRMHQGFNIVTQAYELCVKCKTKCIDFNNLTHDEIDLETIKTA